jgi:hypothetical protein
MEGLGLITTMAPTTTVTAAPTTPTGTKLNTVVDTLTKVADSAAGLITSIKTSGYNPDMAVTQIQPGSMPVQQNNTGKYLLIGGGLLAVGGIIYFATRKKPKK